jgi:hypothetical protein
VILPDAPRLVVRRHVIAPPQLVELHGASVRRKSGLQFAA